MVRLTEEQRNVSKNVAKGEGITLVAAKAGTGKSFMARRLVKELRPKKVLYTAFNRAIVLEAAELFPAMVECKTLHALAKRYTGYYGEIEPLNYKNMPKELSYRAKYEVKEGLEAFYISSSSDMWEFFEEHFDHDNGEKYSKQAVGLIEKMLAKEMPWSFGFMLKYFHLLLVENPSICQYDMVILDECQDTTSVALEIFKLIDAPRKVGLGDPYQAIYAFLNLVDGFEELKGVDVLPLTHSFRCSKEIASSIEKFMQRDLCEDFDFVGTDNIVDNGLELYCALTNAEIIKELAHRIESKKPFRLLRKPVDIFACSLAVLSASGGKKVYQNQYKFLEDVYEDWCTSRKTKNRSFFKYLMEELHDPEIHSAVSLLTTLRHDGYNLFDIYKSVKNIKQTGDYTISTVYTSKGLEFSKVTLSDEFDKAITKIRKRGGVLTKEDKTMYKCYYVACSRSIKTLVNAKMLEGL